MKKPRIRANTISVDVWAELLNRFNPWLGLDAALREILELPAEIRKPQGRAKSANRLRLEALEVGESCVLDFDWTAPPHLGDPKPMRCVANVQYQMGRKFKTWVDEQRLIARRLE